MFLQWRVKRTNGITLWIYYAAQPPLSLSLFLSRLFFHLSFYCQFLHLNRTWLSVWTTAAFTKVIPLILFFPLLSMSFHLQQHILSISSSIFWESSSAYSDSLNSLNPLLPLFVHIYLMVLFYLSIYILYVVYLINLYLYLYYKLNLYCNKSCK